MDVDIDFPTDFDPLDYFKTAIRASNVTNGKLVKHPAGVYFQNMPADKITNFAAIPFKQAEDLGYFKVDFLHLGVLDYFNNKEEIRKLMEVEPDWFLLKSPDVVSRLFQIHQHFNLVDKVKPTSVIELADCIALIRPAKRFMLDVYLKNKDLVRPEIYRKPDNGGYYYKKGHAIAYAFNIVLQLHLIKAKVL